MVSVSDILSAISDDKSLVLFNTIALASVDSSILISRLNLTHKQYYSRLSDLINAGLVRRMNGKYFVTSFGKVVCEAQVSIGKAVQYSSKFKAIDSAESPECGSVPSSSTAYGLNVPVYLGSRQSSIEDHGFVAPSISRLKFVKDII